METRVLDADPLTGKVCYFHYDHATDKTTIETIADVEPVTDVNQFLYNEANTHFGNDPLHHVASIPLVLLPELARKGIMTTGGRILDEKKLKAWLNDRDNLMFRTRPGRV